MHMSIGTLSNKDILCRMLDIYDWSIKAENKYKREAIVDIKYDVRHRIKNGGMIKVIQFNIVMDERKL